MNRDNLLLLTEQLDFLHESGQDDKFRGLRPSYFNGKTGLPTSVAGYAVGIKRQEELGHGGYGLDFQDVADNPVQYDDDGNPTDIVAEAQAWLDINDDAAERLFNTLALGLRESINCLHEYHETGCLTY